MANIVRRHLGAVQAALKEPKQRHSLSKGSSISREKDPWSLNGNEKLFSTICLLLSLWESIRCLDGFDMFMDAVNCCISTNMNTMIDIANASNCKYILVIRQSKTNIHVGSTVRVFRIAYPEHSEGTFAFYA